MSTKKALTEKSKNAKSAYKKTSSRAKKGVKSTRKINITLSEILGFSVDPRLTSKPGSLAVSGKKGQKGKKDKNVNQYKRLLRFEEMEQRLALSADPLSLSIPVPPPEINFGLVYFEDDMSMGKDQSGDVFHINWTGGANGTTLTEVRINLDKNGNGVRDPGEGIFDTEGKNGGVYGHFPFTFISKSGVGSYEYEVEDGGQLLVIKFTDFKEDGVFVFSIDVDEWGARPDGTPNPNAIFEGAEIEGSIITCVFENADYEIGRDNAILFDRYSDPADVGL
ncbi:MAG: hypothetical protein ACRC2T_14510, partial [Thermoguttaceae bacterium]